MFDHLDNIKFEASRISYVRIDGYYFPLINISTNSFQAKIQNDLFAKGDVVSIGILIDDRYGYVRFDTEVEIIDIKDHIVTGEWNTDVFLESANTKAYFDRRYEEIYPVYNNASII